MSLIKKVPIVAEDCELDATTEVITQRRASGIKQVHPLNANTIPYEGRFGEEGFVSIKQKIDELESGGGGSTTDEKVKTTSLDPTAGYLSEKVDENQFEVASNKIKIKDSVLTVEAMNDVDVSSRADGYALVWSSIQNKYVHQYISGSGGSGSDELVKTDSTDSDSGYLFDKVDSNQFELDTTSAAHYIRLKNYGQLQFRAGSANWGYLSNFIDNDTIKADAGAEEIYVDESALSLAALGDVDSGSQADGLYLKWDASAGKYVHAAAGGGDGFTHWKGTPSEYDNLSSYDDNTIYIILKTQ